MFTTAGDVSSTSSGIFWSNASIIKKKNKPQFKEFCPIYCGTAFLDNCKNLESLKLIKFFNVSYPLLLLPFLSRASEIIGKKINVKPKYIIKDIGKNSNKFINLFNWDCNKISWK